MNFGDQVIYVEKGVEYNATAMLVSALEAHAGKNCEPSIGLAFFKHPFVPEYRYDVRHESFDNKGAYWKDAVSEAPEAAPVATAVATAQAGVQEVTYPCGCTASASADGEPLPDHCPDHGKPAKE